MRSIYLQRRVMIPPEHGAWAFLVSPLLVGFFLSGQWHVVNLYLVVAALSAFLIRQPVIIAVKVKNGRLPRSMLPAARLWMLIYAGVGAAHVVGIVMRGFGYVLVLALPGILILAWYLRLVIRREERRQWFVECLAAGALALVAPVGLWVGLGRAAPIGWLLWLLMWAHSSTAIACVYMRLDQRQLDRPPDWDTRLLAAAPALTVGLGVLAVVIALCDARVLRRWVFVPYCLQAAEVVWGVVHPALGATPKAIGYRQLVLTALFTVTFIVAWTG